MAFIAHSTEVLDWLRRCGIDPPPSVRRIVVDLEVGRPARIYFDCFADREIIGQPLDLSGAEIIGSDKVHG